MKKNVLKIILLVFVLLIPFVLIISESNKESLLTRVEKEGYSKQPKDSLWEYVRNEFSYGRIDLVTNYKEKYKDPILITLKNATRQDSLAVNEVINELKEFFPSKEVSYYREFSGEPFIGEKDANFNWKKIDQNLDKLYSYTTQLSFGHSPGYNGNGSSAFNLDDFTEKKFNSRTNKWNTYVFENTLEFSFPDKISIVDKKAFIKHHLFDSMWETHTLNIENPKPSFRKKLIRHLLQYRKASTKLANTYYLRDNAFLLKKIFSTNFREQFENYTHKTYPWRYANHFINNQVAKQNAIVIVGFMGLLILVLSCSLFWNRKSKPSFLNYFYPFLIYLISIHGLKTVYNYLINIDSIENKIIPIAVLFILNILLALVLSFLFWQIDNRIIIHKGNFGLKLLFKMLLTFIFLYLPDLTMTTYTDSGSIEDIVSFTRILNDFQFLFVAIALTLARGLLIYLNYFSDSLVKEKDVELSKLKQLHAQAETKLLQSQITPHFLYNSLNSIASLAPIDAAKTQKMAHSLSDLFKYSINRKGKKMSTVKDEIDMVKSYLDIEKIRFGNRLQFHIEVNETLLNHKIPLFLIQPLVENAVKHGISQNEGEGTIRLKIEKEGSQLLISVSDNGPDFPEGLVSGHGLQTVYDLLRLSYGDKAALNWTNTPEKIITITIPDTV